MKLTLPYPPALNHMYATVRGRRVKSLEARRYANTVAGIAFDEGLQPYEGDVAVTVDVYRPRRVGDLDGRLKAALDSLQGLAYHNDKQIVRIVARRHEDKHNPRIEIEIEEVCEHGE